MGTKLGFALILVAGLGVGCATVPPPSPMRDAPARQVGVASYYGNEHKGHRTASGSRYDPDRLTAAHPTLPFGTRVRVTNLDNGRSVVVTITDRGPYRHGRIIDVSRRAAKELGFVREGTTRVRVDVVSEATAGQP
jgi:rare lipoprotein A